METPTHNNDPRREVATRHTAWAMGTARLLARAGLRPNTISAMSVVFAAAAGACLALSPRGAGWHGPALLVGAILAMQLRLLCNLFDGMVAVECGFKTRSGAIFNDLPDRLADPTILIGAGYAAQAVPFGVELGWVAALLAVLTAYVRVLGGASGARQYFLGPMAKQHRMAVMTVAALAAAVAHRYAAPILASALAVVAVGCAITVGRRVIAAVRELEAG